MDAASRTSLVILAVIATGAALYWLRDIMGPFALAVFLWLVIDGFADAIYARSMIAGKRRITSPIALALALIIVAAGAFATVMVIADSAQDFASKSSGYVGRLDSMIATIHETLQRPLGLPPEPPRAGELFRSLDLPAFLREVARAAQATIQDGVLIVIYVGFLFAAEASFAKRLANIFQRSSELHRARETIGAIRASVEQFIWVQTWTGAITAAISWGLLQFLGLDNALFWAFLIFVVSYVPTIGPIVATLLPSLFAVVQFDEPWRILAVFLSVGAPQFLMGNIIQPRVQGETLNLSTLVVLLGLAVWGKIWGVTGMFLSSPLMVAIMVMLAYQPGAHWLAVLMSSDGRPDKGRSRRAFGGSNGAGAEGRDRTA